MGCDIHAMIEYRYAKGKAWFVAATALSIGRYYELFGYLAGVRDDVTPLAEPRGFPTNSCYSLTVKDIEKDESQWNFWGDHTASWLTAKELKKLKPKFKKDPWYKCVVAYAKRYGDENVRLVFNFDS
jgi:hypothetical protein